ncbi:MAG: hypothetical protein M3Y48_17100 [Actinomycetota bacterium]|nr:hypothetical protein [Actinomycetota bacterium]
MSLTGHLYNGALGAWCTTHLPGTGPVVDQVQAAVKGIDPVRPVGSVDRGHWATVGGAFGQRLAFVISHEPPYAGLLGAARSGLLGSRALNAICALFLSHRDLPDPYRARASELRPVPGDWADFNGAGHRCLWGLPPYADSRAQGQIEVRCSDLVEMLDDEQRAGIGELTAFSVDEEDLAQLCLDFARWESAYRGGPPVTPTWSEPSKDAVQEMVHLAARIPLADFHRLTEKLPDRAPMGFSSPTFVHRWAEGDVIVGSTLIDVKAVASVYDRPRVASWLYQLIAYAWLDAADMWRVRGVGLYLARHGVLLTWHLADLEAALVGDPRRVDATRAAFLNLAHRLIRADGGVPPIITPQPACTA